MIPGLSKLDDNIGYKLFALVHVALFLGLSIVLYDSEYTEMFRTGLDIFVIVHLILHILFLKHKENRFKDWISYFLIGGAAVCGTVDLIL